MTFHSFKKKGRMGPPIFWSTTLLFCAVFFCMLYIALTVFHLTEFLQATYQGYWRGATNIRLPNSESPLFYQLSPIANAASGSRSELLFLSFGDWGGITSVSLAVTNQMAHYMANYSGSCQFLLSVGDNFYDSGVSSIRDPQWNTTFERLFSAPSLRSLRFYSSLGNHDHRGNTSAQVRYTRSHKNTHWFMPSPYYTQVIEVNQQFTVQLFVLNSYDHPRWKQQLVWIEQELQLSTADWKFVVNHNPVYSGGTTHGHQTGFGRWREWTRELIVTLLPLLRKYHVHAYFSGDDHTLQILQRHNIDFFVSGAGGGRMKIMFHGVRPINETICAFTRIGGFIAHHINQTTLVSRVITQFGNEICHHVYTK